MPSRCKNKRLTWPWQAVKWAAIQEGFPSGQREQTVNLPRKLRRFESFSLHQMRSREGG